MTILEVRTWTFPEGEKLSTVRCQWHTMFATHQFPHIRQSRGARGKSANCPITTASGQRLTRSPHVVEKGQREDFGMEDFIQVGCLARSDGRKPRLQITRLKNRSKRGDETSWAQIQRSWETKKNVQHSVKWLWKLHLSLNLQAAFLSRLPAYKLNTIGRSLPAKINQSGLQCVGWSFDGQADFWKIRYWPFCLDTFSQVVFPFHVFAFL